LARNFIVPAIACAATHIRRRRNTRCARIRTLLPGATRRPCHAAKDGASLAARPPAIDLMQSSQNEN
jgi:hypothetical protein